MSSSSKYKEYSLFGTMRIPKECDLSKAAQDDPIGPPTYKSFAEFIEFLKAFSGTLPVYQELIEFKFVKDSIGILVHCSHPLFHS